MATKKNSGSGSSEESVSPKAKPTPRAKAGTSKTATSKTATSKTTTSKTASGKTAGAGAAGSKQARAGGSGPRTYTELSVSSFQHPADRAATAALTAIPGLDTVVRWLIEQGYERALYQQNLAASVRIGPSQLPSVHESFVSVLTVLDLPGAFEKPPVLYVGQNPELNAMTIGSQNPYVVLTSRLVEVLDANELRAVMGHEVGHIMASHVLYHTALQILLGISVPLLSPGTLPLTAVRLALLEWFRAAELTCDRAAVLAVDDPELVCRTLMVLGAGLPSSQLSLPSFMDQVRDYQEWDDGPDRLRRFLSLLNQTHGTPVRRASEIMRWVDSGEFDRIRSGDYVRLGNEADVGKATGEAVAHYGERFRDIASAAGESVSKVSNKLQSWLQSD